jgi:hypothetical protein
MATLVNNPFRITKGILGNIFFRTQNKKTVAVTRSKRPNGKNSDGEIYRKRKFSITSAFAKHACRLFFIKDLWKSHSKSGCSAFHQICRFNYQYSSASRPTELNIITPEGFPITLEDVSLDAISVSFRIQGLKNIAVNFPEASLISVNLLITYFDASTDEAGPFDIIEFSQEIDSPDFGEAVAAGMDFDDEQQYIAQNYKQYLLHAAVIILTAGRNIIQYSSTFAQSGLKGT